MEVLGLLSYFLPNLVPPVWGRHQSSVGSVQRPYWNSGSCVRGMDVLQNILIYLQLAFSH
uniref:Uncharacterized protein n=1 Tax=Arundo donax TaxID=35708 RepID=A0A0A9A6Z5_ARUDO